MKKILFICIVALFCVAGCGSSSVSYTGVEETKKSELNNDARSFGSIIPEQRNVSTYGYYGDVKYVAVSHQNIKDGTRFGLHIVEYVNLDNGLMYVYTEKYSNGYGTTWCEIKNPDGSLVVYEHLEELRKAYNWSKE